MRLKSLSIKGFKSFADETEINFNENLIGIVGPNGSGKSNVVDAIRWVLGEQKTSELRLENMSDVIFNGSKERKEGRISRVVLTFDNTNKILPTDFQEVSIARLLYRDGTSEYRLNDVPCRKKDIQSLFLDSGIGSHSYAIISLNMVEDILHDNGGSRRYMIEQAAGISKYKVRKKETLSKLKSTSEDLERVNDLLFEIQKNLTSFEKQAKRTEKYNELKDEYKLLSINISKIEIASFNEILRDLNQRQTKLSDEKLSFEKQLIEKTAFIEKIKLDILTAEQSLNKEQQEYNHLIENLGKSENEKNLIIQQIINSNERLQDIEQSNVAIEQSQSNAQNQINILQVTITDLEELIKISKVQLEKSIDYLENRRSLYDNLRVKEKNIKEKIASHQSIKSQAEKEIESYRTRAKFLAEDIFNFHNRKNGILQTQESLEKTLEISLNKAEELQKSQQILTAQLETFEKETLELTDKITTKEARYNKKQLDVSSLNQQKKFLENVIENNEGRPEAVKHILKYHKNVKLFSDIIEVLDDSLTSIIELFFERYLHHLIIDSEENAIKLIDEVKAAQKGKLRLFVLDKYNNGSTRPEDLRDNDLIPLRSLIRVNTSYTYLVNTLTDGVYITPKGIYSIELSSLLPGNTVLSAKDYMLYTIGEIHGGSNTLFEGVQLGRHQLLEKINSTISRTEKDQIGDLNEINQLKNSKSNLLSSISEIKNRIKKESYTLELQRQEVYKQQSQIKNQKENIHQIDLQLSEKSLQLTDAESALNQKERHLMEIMDLNVDDLNDKELSAQIAAIYADIGAANQERENSQRQVYEVQNKHTVLLKEIEFHSNTIKSIEYRKEGIAVEKKQLQERVSSSNDRLRETEIKLIEHYEKKSSLQSKLSQQEDKYFQEKGRVFEYEKELNEIRNLLNQKESLLSMTNEKISQNKFDRKAIVDRNHIEFGIELGTQSEKEPSDAELDLEKLRLNKSKMQDKLRNFGEINPMAISAYNEIKERYDHISKEQNDILGAKSSLEDTITEIEEAASLKFNNSLDLIRENFKKVFQGLFSEDDDCDIILLDTDDPLEAKIEIVAKPKGKKPKSISLLSGGEKTLTAASFLFALYLLKPAPFCIFDEVDAPLDDVNIQKFNKLIRKFSNDSQFIVITHNKLTMAEVDILYGVYLKEPGVSGLSAVDFRSFDPADLQGALA